MTKDFLMSFNLTFAGTAFWWKTWLVMISFAPFSLIRASAKSVDMLKILDRWSSQSFLSIFSFTISLVRRFIAYPVQATLCKLSGVSIKVPSGIWSVERKFHFPLDGGGCRGGLVSLNVLSSSLRASALTFNVSATRFIVGLSEGSLSIIFPISLHEKWLLRPAMKAESDES